MKSNLLVVGYLCVVILTVSAFESEGQNIESFMKLEQYKAFQTPLFSHLSNQTDLLKVTDIGNKAKNGENTPWFDTAPKNLKEASYFEMGINCGLPSIFNCAVGYWIGSIGFRLTGMYFDSTRNGIQLNIGYKLSDNTKRRHTLALIAGMSHIDVGDRFVGAVYDLNYKWFFGEIGLGYPYATWQLGYMHRFFPKPKFEKPPLSGERITGEILAGGVGATAGMFSGMFLGYLLGSIGEELNQEEDPRAMFGLLFGFTGISIGSATGVYKVGSIGNEEGSRFATLIGSIFGEIIGGYVVGYVVNLLVNWDNATWQIVVPITIGLCVGSSLGATTAFNLSRRYKSPPISETALVNFSDGLMSLAVSTVTFRPSPYVDLVKVRF